MTEIFPVDPRDAMIRPVLGAHLAFTHSLTPDEHVRALDLDGLVGPTVTLFGVRRQGHIVGIGALKHLEGDHAELKSMHVLAASRGRGVGRALVEHLVAVAAGRGMRRVSLETGTLDAFAPARGLYASLGFLPCEPFADYTANPYSTCMTLDITHSAHLAR